MFLASTHVLPTNIIDDDNTRFDLEQKRQLFNFLKIRFNEVSFLYYQRKIIESPVVSLVVTKTDTTWPSRGIVGGLCAVIDLDCHGLVHFEYE